MGITPGPEMKQLLALLRAACLDHDLQPEGEAAWIEMFMEKGL